MINKRIQEICARDSVNLPKITMYWARHTFANLQRETSASIEEIHELFGHSEIRVTENYVKRFDEDKKSTRENK